MATLGKKFQKKVIPGTTEPLLRPRLPYFLSQGFLTELKVLVPLIKLSWNYKVTGPDHTKQKFWDYVGKDIK